MMLCHVCIQRYPLARPSSPLEKGSTGAGKARCHWNLSDENSCLLRRRVAKTWLRCDWSSRHVESQWFLHGLGSVPNGVRGTFHRGTSTKERWKAHTAPRGCATAVESNLATAGYCGQGCDTLAHLYSDGFVCCLAFYPRGGTPNFRCKLLLRRGHVDRKCRKTRCFCTFSRKTFKAWRLETSSIQAWQK